MKTLRLRALAAVAIGLLTGTVAFADAPTAHDAWARATPPGSDTAAVYLVIRGGHDADHLEWARTPRAAMAHLHTVEESGGMMRMRAVDRLEIPAGKDVALAPQGLHLMLMGVDHPLVSGEHFPVTLHFTRGGDRVIDVQVVPATAAGPPAHQP
jgi:periplasmic copper chaperone A